MVPSHSIYGKQCAQKTTDSLYKTTEAGITLAVCSLFLEEHNLSIRVHWFQMGKATHIPRKEI